MTWAVTAGAVSGGLGYMGASRAADAQKKAAREALDLQRQMFQYQTAMQQPYINAGNLAQNRLMEYMGLGGNQQAEGYGRYAKDFGMADYQADPGYAFRLSEGMKALQNQQAARGGLYSGAALKAAEGYGQDLASQEYQNAYQRYQQNRANQLNALSGIMGAGQQAAGVAGNAAGQFGQLGGESLAGYGNARASGYMGGANALASGIGIGANIYSGRQTAEALNNLAGQMRQSAYGDTGRNVYTDYYRNAPSLDYGRPIDASLGGSKA